MTDSVIEVHVAEPRRLFNAMDASPFNDRDLDPGAAAFIVQWARQLPRDVPLSLVVYFDEPGASDRESVVPNAISEYFANRAAAARLRLRELFRRGRISLVIGLLALVALTSIGDLLAVRLGQTGFGAVARESLAIGGWVAMWRPIEVFLYDWWPIIGEARFFDRLAQMNVTIAHRDPDVRPR